MRERMLEEFQKAPVLLGRLTGNGFESIGQAVKF